MDQAFDCLCSTPSCRGRISGAKDMTDAQLEGLWINGHILELREEQKESSKTGNTDGQDPTAQALKFALEQAEKVVIAARSALLSYAQTAQRNADGRPEQYGVDKLSAIKSANGSQRRGPTSRELSGEMGGDTIVA
jgi:hypothetical protein